MKTKEYHIKGIAEDLLSIKWKLVAELQSVRTGGRCREATGKRRSRQGRYPIRYLTRVMVNLVTSLGGGELAPRRRGEGAEGWGARWPTG